LQLVARFSSPNGFPLMANSAEGAYRDPTGQLLTGTPPMQVQASSTDLSKFSMTIPYFAFNLPFSRGLVTYPVNVTIFAYLNNFLIGQSPTASFFVQW